MTRLFPSTLYPQLCKSSTSPSKHMKLVFKKRLLINWFGLIKEKMRLPENPEIQQRNAATQHCFVPFNTKEAVKNIWNNPSNKFSPSLLNINSQSGQFGVRFIVFLSQVAPNTIYTRNLCGSLFTKWMALLSGATIPNSGIPLWIKGKKNPHWLSFWHVKQFVVWIMVENINMLLKLCITTKSWNTLSGFIWQPN